MPVRPAATVMLVRDAAGAGAAPAALEVLMVRRNLRSDFVGGAYVFPGGAVDPPDGGAEAEAACTGRTDAEASALLGLGSGGLAYWVAVLRETFEEAGLLLAERPGGPALLAGDPAEEARFAAARRRVNAGTRRFLDLCRDERLRLRWATSTTSPTGSRPGARRAATTPASSWPPRRPGQKAAHDAGETIAEVWISPDEALAGHRAGEIEIIFPTIRNLQAIGRFATSAELLTAAAAAPRARCPTIEPRVVADGNGVRIVLPGDDAYERGSRARPDGDGAPGRLQRGRPGRLHGGQRGGARAAPAPARRLSGGRRRLDRDPGRARLRPRSGPGARAGSTSWRPGVRRLTAPNPGLMTGPGTNTYLVGHVRPGRGRPRPDGRGHTGAIAGRRRRRSGRSAAILVTHTHVDHAPGAAALAAATGAQVVGFGPAEGFAPDQRVGEGWTLDAARLTRRPHPARRCTRPGHASDHLCWLVEEHAMLLTGDHVMHGSTVVIRPPDGDLDQYLASLALVRDAGPPCARWPGSRPPHGPRRPTWSTR